MKSDIKINNNGDMKRWKRKKKIRESLTLSWNINGGFLLTQLVKSLMVI